MSCPSFRFLALSGFSSSNSSSSSCVASKLARFDFHQRNSRLHWSNATHVRLKRRNNLLVVQRLPVNPLEPRMSLNIRKPSPTRAEAQPFVRIAVKELFVSPAIHINPYVPIGSPASLPSSTSPAHPRATSTAHSRSSWSRPYSFSRGTAVCQTSTRTPRSLMTKSRPGLSILVSSTPRVLGLAPTRDGSRYIPI